MQLIGAVMFTQSVRIFQILIPIAIFTFTCGVYYEMIFRKSKSAAIMAFPMAVLLLSALFEIYSYRNSAV